MPAAPNSATIVVTLMIDPWPRAAICGPQLGDQEVRRLHVEAVHEVEVLLGGLVSGPEREDAGAVDQDVDRSGEPRRPLDQSPRARLVAQVRRHEVGRAAARPDLLDHLFAPIAVAPESTTAPSLASASAAARPMPLLPPVTRAAIPDSSDMIARLPYPYPLNSRYKPGRFGGLPGRPLGRLIAPIGLAFSGGAGRGSGQRITHAADPGSPNRRTRVRFRLRWYPGRRRDDPNVDRVVAVGSGARSPDVPRRGVFGVDDDGKARGS